MAEVESVSLVLNTPAARLIARGEQRPILLDETQPGQFRGAATATAGQWDLVIELSRDGVRLFRSKNRIALK